ncbi:integrase, catalytic region, zinc finger, CCHC-type containing protein, partial [Tanacetum coccineum]
MGLNDLINWYQSLVALDLGSTMFLKNMISMKNKGTAEVFEGTEEVHEATAQVNESTAEVNESTAEKIKVPLVFVKVPLVLSDISEHTDEEIDEQELEAHYSYMAKIQEVPNADSGTNAEPLEQVSNDIMCSYLQSSSALDEITDIQCLYLHKVRECDCLAQKLSEQTVRIMKKTRSPPDIQCAGSDTRPPMLDKTDFASWQQHIRLYCRGKENGVNILKSIDEGPFQMGTMRVFVAEGTEEQNRGLGKNAWGGGAAGYGGAQNRVGLANPGQARQVKCYNCNGVGHIARNCTQPNATRTPKTSKDKIVADSKLKRIGVVLENSNIVPKLNNDLTRALKPNRVLKAPTYTVADNSLNAELAIYKEQVKLYDRRSQGLKYKHFDGIQKALKKEVKEMSDAFDELEAELDQHVVDRKHDEIERKNLIIANDNLIDDCLYKEVFYVVSNSELNVSRFTEMQNAHNVVKARCLELEAELSKLRDKIQNDDHNELVNRFSNLEVNHFNLQLKYQNLKESFRNNFSLPARDTPDFDSVFVIGKMKASLQGKDNITQLNEKINVFQDQNELFRAENEKVKQHYKELYDSIKIMRAKHLDQTTALITENENLKAQIQNNVQPVTTNLATPKSLALGKYAIDVEPIPSRNINNREVHLTYLKHLKESVDTIREIIEVAKAERPLDRSLASACLYTKHSQEL